MIIGIDKGKKWKREEINDHHVRVRIVIEIDKGKKGRREEVIDKHVKERIIIRDR